MNELLRECSLDESCSYLKNEIQKTHYKIIDNCSIAQCESLIERGWRRFGSMFFRPICDTCTACESVKIDVKNYIFSKSKRRIMKKNKDISIHIQRPSMSQKHIDIFNTYHEHMKYKRDWDGQETTPKNYYMSFVHGHQKFGYEVLYFDDERLIAVDLIDILPNGISSIYFYYDPIYESHSLGTYSLLKQIEYAREKNLDWIYLGYYVKGCQSLEYKASYQPLLTLEQRPKEDEEFIWSK